MSWKEKWNDKERDGHEGKVRERNWKDINGQVRAWIERIGKASTFCRRKMNHAKWWSSNFTYWHVMIHTTQMEIFLSCCLRINSFNVWLQVLQYSSVKRGSFELSYSFLFGLGLAHIDETRGLKRVYETAFGLWFGESSNFKSWKKIPTTGHERHWKTWVDMTGSEITWKDGVCQWNKN